MERLLEDNGILTITAAHCETPAPGELTLHPGGRTLSFERIVALPELFGPLGSGIGGQVLAGSIASFVCAYLAVRYLTRYFQTRTLTPFAVYCALVGAVSLAWLTLR